MVTPCLRHTMLSVHHLGCGLGWLPVLERRWLRFQCCGSSPKMGGLGLSLLLSLPCPPSMDLATPVSQREKGYTPTKTLQPRVLTKKKSLKEEHSGLPFHHPGVNLSGDSQGSASPHGPGMVERVLPPEGGTRHGAWA